MNLARLAPLVLVFSAIVAYHNSLSGPFIFDDVLNIRNNYKIRQLTPVWETMWGPLDTGVSGRPVVQMSYALGYAMHGLNVRGYHVENLVLHILTSLVLFGVVRRTLLTARLAPRFGEQAAVLALVVALVWQVHPLLTDTVTYISGRTEILGGLFLLLTLYCAIRAGEERRASPPAKLGSIFSRLWQVGAILSCAIGTGAKEILVAAPLLVLIYDRLFIADSFRDALRSRMLMYVGLLLSLGLIPLNLSMADFHRPALVGQDQLNSWDYLKAQSQVLVLYLRLAIWPHPLILDYFGWDARPSLVSVLPHALFILALLVATAFGLWRLKPAAYAGAWFFLILAPTSSLLPLPTEVATERRMYLPLMGIAALFVLGAYRLLGSSRSARRAGVALLAVVLLAEFGRTYWRNEDFKDPVALWTDVTERRPTNARAFDNLAYELLGRGQDAEALANFRRAVELNPSNFKGLNNVAAMLIRQGKHDEAVPYIEQALVVQPTYASPHLNMGRIHLAKGALEKAEAAIRESLRLQPDRVDSRVALSQVLTARGDFAQAEREAGAALQLDPQSAAAYDALGMALAGAGGRDKEAMQALLGAFQRAQTDVEYATHVAWHLAAAEDKDVRNPKEAVNLATRVIELARREDDPTLLDALALAQAADGQYAVAAETAKRALDLAKSQGSPRAATIEQRLASYRAGRFPEGALKRF